MLKPVITKIKSRLSPWDVFRAVYSKADVCIFLDSIRRRHPDQNYSYIALNPFLEMQIDSVTGAKPGRLKIWGAENKTVSANRVFDEMRRVLKKYGSRTHKAPVYFSGGALGYWGYEMVSLFESVRFRRKKKAATPVFYQGFFQDVIVYDHVKEEYLLIANVFSPAQIQRTAALQRIKQMQAFFTETPAAFSDSGSAMSCRPEISQTRFMKMVKKARRYIEAGDIYQANLSQRFLLKYTGSKPALYDALRRINPSPFASYLKIRDVEIISSSPERLISKRGAHCETRPIAGTRPVKRQAKALSAIKRELLASDKERAEHIMLVDLERNDLGRVCSWRSVRVEEMMTLEKYSHVVHIVSKIIGRLKTEHDVFDLLRAMFPGGTITGCPKVRCMEVIDELEPAERGLYTGSVGHIDFYGNMDLNIVIRTLVFKGSDGCFQAGAGIVYDSDPLKEYEETLHKGEALVEALVQAGKKARA